MQTEYSFNSEEEPTEEQLAWLMNEMAKDVKLRADIANRIFMENLQQMIDTAIKKRLTTDMPDELQ